MQVCEEDIEEMFTTADADCDGKISYKEFQTMMSPPHPPTEQGPAVQASTSKKVTIQDQEKERRDTHHEDGK